jgi:hypothetical protein
MMSSPSAVGSVSNDLEHPVTIDRDEQKDVVEWFRAISDTVVSILPGHRIRVSAT